MSVRDLKNVSSDIFSDIHTHVVIQICTLIMDWHQNHFYVKTNPIKLWLVVYNTCDDTHILIGSYLWSIGEQMLRWCHHQHILASLLHKKIRFHVVMSLFSYRSLQMRKMWKEYQWHTWQHFCATFWFSPHFDVICDLLLNWHTETWYLFVIYNIIIFTTNLLSSLAIATASLPLSATLNRCTWRPLSAINFLLWNSWRFSHLTGVILTALAWK